MLNNPEDIAQPLPYDDSRTYSVVDPDDETQPCPHGDYRSCVVEGCLPMRRVHTAGVIVSPPPQVACMWCGESSARGQCAPCSALLDAMHAAPRAGALAIINTMRAAWEDEA